MGNFRSEFNKSRSLGQIWDNAPNAPQYWRLLWVAEVLDFSVLECWRMLLIIVDFRS